MYMLCVTGSVDCLWGICVLKIKINCGYLRVFYVQFKGISIIRKCSVVCQWITGLHWMQDFPGWQTFVEDRTSLEYTMSCISLHLGKNYGAVCVTGSVDQKRWGRWGGGGGCLQTCIKVKTPQTYIKVKTPPTPPTWIKGKPSQTCIKGKCILCSVTGSQDFSGGQDFAGGQGHWRASHCRRAGLHGGQGRA